MKTLIYGISIGLFGAVALSLASFFAWPSWVLFIAWISFSFYGKSVKKSINIYLEIILGIFMGVLIEVLGDSLSIFIGSFSSPLALFLLTSSLPFITKIKGLDDIEAWFIGMIVFFGVHPPLELVHIIKLFPPLAAGFIFAYVLDTTVTKFVPK
ncbi:uncharacterized protein DUF1097 [Tenacibaculum adriaticum]|uniref:Uncharacterized protein DUF1097 n=1 Tax=Tenacibaculum adriaticum TaxID=413713 RepID=A0A5S5DR34_9FLAO|nr:DUF1097 domain-containing protein [Tenacibaculum adriaticum]TYP98195.1 uncharacterized protein DUF1097 [Tenacibaculum adriaticum]